MKGIKEFSVPSSLDYTYKLLHMHQGNAVVLAGGTHLGLQKKSKYGYIVDLRKAGLGYIKNNADSVEIGAMTRAVDIINSDLLKSFAGGILVEAADKIASPLTQNMVTIGGNIYTMFPWSNLPPALLVLDAEVVISSLDTKKTTTITELYMANPRKYIDNEELITAIVVPKSSEALKTAYKVFCLTERDHDLVIVATALKMDGNVCQKAKVALGAAISPCALLENVQNYLVGKELTADVLEEAAKISVENIQLVNDFRTTDEHRIDVIKTLVKRALEDCKK